MKISLNVRRARGRAKLVDHKQQYVKNGRRYYEKNRRNLLTKSRRRYTTNKSRYARSRVKWLRKTANGKRPLYLVNKAKGRRPVFPRLKPLFRKTTRPISTRRPSPSGRAWR